MFSDGRQEARYLPLPGQGHKVMTEKLITNIDTIIKGNRRRNVRDVVDEFNFSIGIVVQKIVTNTLKYRKVCFQWVPRMLPETANGSDFTQHLLRYRDDCDDFCRTKWQGVKPNATTSNRKVNSSACNRNIPTHVGPKNSKFSCSRKGDFNGIYRHARSSIFGV
ncbi:hypothetical protein TNCV_4703381 [Trichonephila clavipes]|nr:hypothetical protein TNCV_4703381 [Trichonephila clavipes]